jgi:hypothetical protein
VFCVENRILKGKDQAPRFPSHNSGRNLDMLGDASFFFSTDLRWMMSFFLKKKKRCVTEPDFAGPLVMGQALGMSSFFSFFLFYSFDF